MTNIKHLSKKYNVSESYLEIISDKAKLELVIDDIRSDRGDVHIEVIQFIQNTNYFPLLDKKLGIKRRELSNSKNIQNRIILDKEIQNIESEIKQYKLDILMTSFILWELEDVKHLEQVKSLFFMGDIDQALSSINGKELKAKRENLLLLLNTKQDLQTVYDLLVDNAYEFFIKGHLTILNLTIKLPNVRFEKAVYFFDKGVVSIERSKQEEKIAHYKLKYGNFLQDHRSYEKAYSFLEVGLKIIQKLATSRPKYFMSIIAMIHNNQANILIEQNDIEQAEKKYKKALRIAEGISGNLSNNHQADMARTINNLAHVELKKNNIEKAVGLYNKSLVIYGRVAESDPNYLPLLASVYNGLGIAYEYGNDLELAEKNYMDALGIRKRLEEKNEMVYSFSLAETLNNIGILKHKQNKIKEAIQNLSDALLIFKKNVKVYPQIYLPNVAKSLNNLAILYRDNNKFSKSERLFIEAEDLFKKLAKQRPAIYTSFLAGNQINLARLYQNELHNKEGSLKLVDEALTYLFPLRHIPFFQTYINEACKILDKWKIDYGSYLLEKYNLVEDGSD